MGTSCIAKFSTFSLFFSFWFSFRKVLDHLFTTPSIIILVFVMSRVMTFPISVVRPMFVVMMMVTVVLLPFPAHVAGHHHPLVTPQKSHHFTFQSTPEHRHESSWTFESNVQDDLTTNNHQDATTNHPSNVNDICTLELLLAVAGLPAPPPPFYSPTPSSPSSTPS